MSYEIKTHGQIGPELQELARKAIKRIFARALSAHRAASRQRTREARKLTRQLSASRQA